jgi:hypothetical protein
MTKKILATAALFLSLSASTAFAETLKGMINDEMCATKHKPGNAADMECAKKCVKGGSPAVLVVGDKVYKIDNQDAVKDHIGDTVTVTGKVTGDTIHISKVKA